MLRCGIGRLQAGIARTKGGMTADAPFKHTHTHYTPICAAPLMGLWASDGPRMGLTTGPGVKTYKNGTPRYPEVPIGGTIYCHCFMKLKLSCRDSTEPVTAAGCLNPGTQCSWLIAGWSRLSHGVAGNRHVRQITDSSPHCLSETEDAPRTPSPLLRVSPPALPSERHAACDI